MKKLLRESEWLRTYETDFGLEYESKLLVDDQPLSPDSIIARWGDFTADEKWEFALAFQARGRLDPEDVPLIDFLLQAGNAVVYSTIAPILPMHPRKETALTFLLTRIRQEGSHRANYFQAVELFDDARAIPTLVNIQKEMRPTSDHTCESWSIEQAVDFVACSRALWKLTENELFRSDIEEFLHHPDSAVRRFASLALK